MQDNLDKPYRWLSFILDPRWIDIIETVLPPAFVEHLSLLSVSTNGSILLKPGRQRPATAAHRLSVSTNGSILLKLCQVAAFRSVVKRFQYPRMDRYY
jgi:hypothetical protein